MLQLEGCRDPARSSAMIEKLIRTKYPLTISLNLKCKVWRPDPISGLGLGKLGRDPERNPFLYEQEETILTYLL